MKPVSDNTSEPYLLDHCFTAVQSQGFDEGVDQCNDRFNGTIATPKTPAIQAQIVKSLNPSYVNKYIVIRKCYDIKPEVCLNYELNVVRMYVWKNMWFIAHAPSPKR